MDLARTDIYLDGAWVAPSSGHTIPVHNPATEELLARVPAGTAADVDRAVAAARAAFPGWAATTPAQRSAVLDRLHAALASRAAIAAETVALELGTPLRVATRVQVGLPLTVLRSYVDLAARPPAEETVGNSLVVREPVGVVGAITPWNYPLHQVMAKVAPALAAGCTVVLKPSELTPLTAYLLFDAIHEAGFPPGWSTWCPAPASRWARPSPPTRTSTWSPSPARPPPAGGSRTWPPTGSPGWRWSSAASPPT